MQRDNNSKGIQIIAVALVFITINIILFESGLAFVNPFYSFFRGLSNSIMYSFDISFSLIYMPFFLMYLPVIILGIYYMLKQDELEEGMSDTNLYFEYRQWNFFWGFFFDGKKEVQKILNHHNSKGWKLVDFEWANLFSHLGIIKTLGIYYVTFLTFGVLSFWGGFFAIFEGVKKAEENLNNAEPPVMKTKKTDIKTEPVSEQKEVKSINDIYTDRT